MTGTNNEQVGAVAPQQLPKVAAKRGVQTLWVALIAVALVDGIAPLISAVNGADGWRGLASTWEVWTWGIFKGAFVAALTALGAWLQRRYLDKSGVETIPGEIVPEHSGEGEQ